MGVKPTDTDSKDAMLQDGDFKLNEHKAVIKYLCRKYMPKLLGRTPQELGLAEMISVVHDTRPLNEVMELLGNKNFLCGENPTFIDFCVYESMIENPALNQVYFDRVKELTHVKAVSTSRPSLTIWLKNYERLIY